MNHSCPRIAPWHLYIFICTCKLNMSNFCFFEDNYECINPSVFLVTVERNLFNTEKIHCFHQLLFLNVSCFYDCKRNSNVTFSVIS